MDYWRQLDILPMEKLKEQHAHLVGAGGIGSPAAIALAKMGIGSLTIWDDDLIEEHNLPNQIHLADSIGDKKAPSLEALLACFVSDEVKLESKTERVTEESKLTGIVISAVDSMESRKSIWAATRMSVGSEFFIDARMGGEMLRLYCVNPHDPLAVEEYEKTLYSDEESLELPCTAQSIIYTGVMAGSLIANAVKRYVAGDDIIFEIVLDLPSFTLLTR